MNIDDWGNSYLLGVAMLFLLLHFFQDNGYFLPSAAAKSIPAGHAARARARYTSRRRAYDRHAFFSFSPHIAVPFVFMAARF